MLNQNLFGGLIMTVSLAVCLGSFCGCENELGGNSTKTLAFENTSVTPNFLKLTPEFSGVSVYSILSSEDTYLSDFVYGSMADGAGLIAEADGTYTLINNIEADYSIARITMDKNLKPTKGEYILNAAATASTAQCSGSMITPQEHGFGPLYLSGGEWGGNSKGVFVTDPYKSSSAAGSATMLPALGAWSTENAVAIGKEAYPGKTVVFIGDDDSANQLPMEGQLAMYIGDQGDLEGGKLYGLSIPGFDNTVGKSEINLSTGTEYEVSFTEFTGDKTKDALQAEAEEKGMFGFQRVEDIDWRRGNPREIYFVATGRNAEGGTKYGRVYKLILDENDPLKGTLSIIVDGDAKGSEMLSPDNITVTENYAYIQEDPNFGFSEKNHFARLYQYNLSTGDLKTVLECDQQTAAATNDQAGFPYGTTDSTWEITGMIDVSDQTGTDGTFILITQNHGWGEIEGDTTNFFDPNAAAGQEIDDEGSQLYILKGLAR